MTPLSKILDNSVSEIYFAIETFFVKGLPHGWYGDRNGQYAFANAPDTI